MVISKRPSTSVERPALWGAMGSPGNAGGPAARPPCRVKRGGVREIERAARPAQNPPLAEEWRFARCRLGGRRRQRPRCRPRTRTPGCRLGGPFSPIRTRTDRRKSCTERDLQNRPSEGGAESGALFAASDKQPLDVAKLASRLAELPPSVLATIEETIRAAGLPRRP